MGRSLQQVRELLLVAFERFLSRVDPRVKLPAADLARVIENRTRDARTHSFCDQPQYIDIAVNKAPSILRVRT